MLTFQEISRKTRHRTQACIRLSTSSHPVSNIEAVNMSYWQTEFSYTWRTKRKDAELSISDVPSSITGKDALATWHAYWGNGTTFTSMGTCILVTRLPLLGW